MLFAFRGEIKRKRIDAVALAGGLAWSVIEDVAEMSATVSAGNFGPLHAVRAISGVAHGAGNRLIKARPAAARIVLGVRAEQNCTTVRAGVVAIVSDMQKLAGKRRFGGLVEQDGFLLCAEVRVLLHSSII